MSWVPPVTLPTPGKSRYLHVAGRLHHDRLVQRSPALATAALAMLAGASGCFFNEPINERPSAEIIRIDGGGVPSRGDELQFRATMLDPDGDPVHPSWRFEACPDDGPCIARDTGTDPVFVVTVPPMAGGGDPTTRVVITLDVTDELGAVARLPERLEIDVVNNEPTVALQRRGRDIGGSFPPDAPIIVTAVGADPDGDALTLSWELIPARNSMSADRHFIRLPDPQSGGEEYELLPDVPGLWTVRVTAFDGVDDFVRDLTIQVIPDAPPCLGASDPQPVAGSTVVLDERRRFSVLVVDDDLDVYPAASNPFLGIAGFRWYLRGPGDADFVHVDTDVAALELDPAQYDPGDRLELRVEIDDRVGRTIPCAADAATCSLGQNSCFQRQTWTLEVR